MDPGGRSCQPHDQPRQHREREREHASTVPSPRRSNGDPDGGPLPSGPWSTNASRPCGTTSTVAVARLTIDREERRNALSWALVGELREALALAKADDAVRVVVLTGAGTVGVLRRRRPRGHGRREPTSPTCTTAAASSPSCSATSTPSASPPSPACRASRSPVGSGWPWRATSSIAADDAVFGTPEIGLGLWPHMITVPMLRAMPPKRALELMLTGRRVDAAEADRIGFVTRVVPVDQLDARRRRGGRRARQPLAARAAAGT